MGHRICYVNTNLLMKFDNMEIKHLFIAIIACIEGDLGVVTLFKYMHIVYFTILLLDILSLLPIKFFALFLARLLSYYHIDIVHPVANI